jgi:hypothetical protein
MPSRRERQQKRAKDQKRRRNDVESIWLSQDDHQRVLWRLTRRNGETFATGYWKYQDGETGEQAEARILKQMADCRKFELVERAGEDSETPLTLPEGVDL